MKTVSEQMELARKAQAIVNDYTQEQIDSDIKNYEGVIVNLAVYDKSQAGEAYMASYTENGVSRTWKDRENLFAGVYPFVKAL